MEHDILTGQKERTGAQYNGRIVRNFNEHWTFCYDPDQQPDIGRTVSRNTVDFIPVALPHT